MRAVSCLIVLGLVACDSADKDLRLEGKSADEVALIRRGKATFLAICTACHNQNPKLDGALGPPVAGASIELLRGKVLSGTYPQGYSPKRPTQQMVPLPNLKDDIAGLAAYLNALK